MISILKNMLIILFSLTMGFGVWYLIILFITLNVNPFEWGLMTKLIYLILGYSSSEVTRETLRKNN
jgi:hypothetical protein